MNVCVCVCERERERGRGSTLHDGGSLRGDKSPSRQPQEMPSPHVKYTCWCCKGRSFLSHLKGNLLPSLTLRVHKNE